MFSTHINESQHKFHCSHKCEINHCSSIAYAKICTYSIPKTLDRQYACDLIHEKSTLKANHVLFWNEAIKGFQGNISEFNKSVKTNNLTALSYSLLVRQQEICPYPCPYSHPCGKSLQVYLFPDVWFWRCCLWRSNHEWDRCTSIFCSCRHLTRSWL